MPPGPAFSRMSQPVPWYPEGLQPVQRSYQAESLGVMEGLPPVSAGAELARAGVRAGRAPVLGPLPGLRRGPQPGEPGEQALPERTGLPESGQPEPG